MRKIKQTKHGYHGTKIYKLWGSIVKRCENQISTNYIYYGGRGIKICEEWRNNPKTFIDWALSNGYKEGLEIDRIDNDGNYQPNNCQFVTHKENCKSKKRRLFKNNKSGFVGLVLTKANTYEAYVQIDGKQKFIGTFKNIEYALNAQRNIHDQKENEE